jgi:hypothetical protein
MVAPVAQKGLGLALESDHAGVRQTVGISERSSTWFSECAARPLTGFREQGVIPAAVRKDVGTYQDAVIMFRS